MEFTGREAELDVLRDWWQHSSDRPALIWGRRRVGKTALLAVPHLRTLGGDPPRCLHHRGHSRGHLPRPAVTSTRFEAQIPGEPVRVDRHQIPPVVKGGAQVMDGLSVKQGNPEA